LSIKAGNTMKRQKQVNIKHLIYMPPYILLNTAALFADNAAVFFRK
jgi:hypothetical protein